MKSKRIKTKIIVVVEHDATVKPSRIRTAVREDVQEIAIGRNVLEGNVHKIAVL